MSSQLVAIVSRIHVARSMGALAALLCSVGCSAPADEVDAAELGLATAASSGLATSCSGSVAAGLCVLADTNLTGGFTVSVCAGDQTSTNCTGYSVNTKIALTPNSKYTVWMGGVSAYGVTFTVPASGVYTVKTGTVVFQTSGTLELQVANDTLSGGVCVQNGAVHVGYGAGSYALLPGTYIADFGGVTCTANEKSFSVVAGSSVTVAR